jgi:murein DD-endopeptidase MepM/ murein hydrolase activator NlpD
MLFILLAAARRRIDWKTGWCWPVPTLIPPEQSDDNYYNAVVSSAFGGPRGGGTRTHKGLDIMYRRRAADKVTNAKFPPNVRQADGFSSTKGFFAPPSTPILAARAGTVWSVHLRDDGGGISVVLDHGKPWATYYTHLKTTKLAPHQSGRRLDVPLGQPQEVAAGDVIGTMGGNESDSERVRHLHFETWYEGSGSEHSIDAHDAGVMTSWERKLWRPSSL